MGRHCPVNGSRPSRSDSSAADKLCDSSKAPKLSGSLSQRKMTYGSGDPGKLCKSSGLSVSKYRKALAVKEFRETYFKKTGSIFKEKA